VKPRGDDIVVSTPAKSGTTWGQAIVVLLLSGDPETHADPSTNAPWIDSLGREVDEVPGRLEAQTKRRQVKTHTPLTASHSGPT
jgi:aryl sulfotransferase